MKFNIENCGGWFDDYVFYTNNGIKMYSQVKDIPLNLIYEIFSRLKYTRLEKALLTDFANE